MSKINFVLEIPAGFYTEEELNNYILNITNSSINAYSSTKGNITIPFKDLFCDNGNQKELERRVKEQKELKRRQNI